MKSYTSTKTMRILWFCIHLSLFVFENNLVGNEMSPALLQVWNVYYSDVGGNDTERIKAEKALSTRPEFKSELFTMLQRDYFDARKKGARGDVEALGALALRKDLATDELKMIYDELANHTEEEDISSFIAPAICLISHYPSPKHEALVLRFLNRGAKQDYKKGSGVNS